MTTSRADEALAAVLARIPAPREDNGHFRVLQSWAESEDTICVIYEGWWEEGKVGLRRKVDSNLPLSDVVAQIVDAELGEPPGLLLEGVAPDADRVRWWNGEPPEWSRGRAPA